MSGLVTLTVVALAIAPLADSGVAEANTLQMSSDNGVTGWYPNEPALTPGNVSGGDFGELFDAQLNGQVYAQALVVQPTVLAVTENDYAYGINSTTGAIEWSDSFGPSADPLAAIGCGDVGNSLGITGTPVIDPSTDVAYFVAATDGGSGGATEWFMHAVNVQTGATAAGWTSTGVQIQGSADNDSGTVFNGDYQTQRPGLVLVDGVVYAAFGSQCDYGSWEGWVVGVSESTPAITTMWSTEEDVTIAPYQPGGGIWASGSAPVVDANGDIFVATGNGDIPGSPEAGTDTSNTTYGEAVVELHANVTTGQLQVVDFFIAADAQSLNNQDGDLGSGGPVALPASMGSTQEPNVMLEVGKQGELYVLNMASLGGYEQGTSPPDSDDVPSEVNLNGGVWSKPAVWPGDGGYVYIPTAGTAGFSTNGGSLDVLQRIDNAGVISFQLVGQTVNSGDTFGYGSGAPIVTSNGTTSGSAVVWIIHANNSSGADSQLEAFNPVPVNPGSSGTLEEIWQSPTFTSTVFAAPGVDNGVVYVGTKDGTLLAFGALPSATPALAGTSPSFASTVVSQSVSGTATFTASSSTTVKSFVVAGAAFSTGTPSLSLPAALSAGQSITVPVTFTPTALGANAGQLTANVTGAATTIALSGQGLTSSATLSASPDEVDFDLQPIAGSTVSAQVTFTNVSGSSINITGFNSPALPFSVPNPPANQTLGAGDSVTFNVDFAPPGSSGDFVHVFNSVATLDSSAGNFGEAIEGTAAPPAQITTIPNSLSFGDVDVGSSATMNFDLGDQGGFPLTITESTPPATDGFSALTNPFTQLAGTSDVLAANTSIVETVQFAPTTTGPMSATWLLEGNDGNGVQTVTLTGVGVTPPPPPPPSPPSPPPSPPSTPTPATLSITTLSGRVGTPLTLGTSGDPDGGALSFGVRDGTAKGCAIVGDILRATSAGTCVVRANKAASGSNPAVSSPATSISLSGKAVVRPAPLTVLFTGTSDALSSADKVTLAALARKLKSEDSLTVTGYAKSATLALDRANVVAAYLKSFINVHVTLKNVSSVLFNKVVVTTT